MFLAFFWLALRTLTCWVSIRTIMRMLKAYLLGGVQESAKFLCTAIMRLGLAQENAGVLKTYLES